MTVKMVREQVANIIPPQHLPFLEAVCWDLDDVHDLTLDEMLNRYERSWDYRGTLADIKDKEKAFISKLAAAKGSWLKLDV